MQEGTPEDILLNPASDYVQSFLQDVNRTKVLQRHARGQPGPADLDHAFASGARAGTDARHEL